jgi:hypothetical protein
MFQVKYSTTWVTIVDEVYQWRHVSSLDVFIGIFLLTAIILTMSIANQRAAGVNFLQL